MLNSKEIKNYIVLTLTTLGLGSVLLNTVPSVLAQTPPAVYGRTDATRFSMFDPFSTVYVPGQSDNPHNIDLIHGVHNGNGRFLPAKVNGQIAKELTFGIENATDGIQFRLADLDVDNKQNQNGERRFASFKVVDADTRELLCDTTIDGLNGITTNSETDKF